MMVSIPDYRIVKFNNIGKAKNDVYNGVQLLYLNLYVLKQLLCLLFYCCLLSSYYNKFSLAVYNYILLVYLFLLN